MKLSPEIIWALNNIWSQIAADVFDAVGELELPQDEIIELVLDADRPVTFHPEVNWTEFNQLPYADRIKLCKEQVFTYEIYC